MGISNSISNLANKVQPKIEGETRPTLPQIVIESNLGRLSAKENSRPEFVFVEIERSEDSGVI
jgi:hypothetical protein